MVEAGQGIEAVIMFYAEHASMQENMGECRIGKELLVKHEKAAQASVTNLRSKCVRPLLISRNIVVIRWAIGYASKQGRPVQFQELAYQHWEDELIVKEQFFYDPGQFN